MQSLLSFLPSEASPSVPLLSRSAPWAKSIPASKSFPPFELPRRSGTLPRRLQPASLPSREMARMDPTSHRAGSRPNPGGSSPLNDSNRLAGPPPPPQPPPSSPLASFAAEMFVWLWFAPPPSPTTEPKDSSSGGGQGGSGGANDADRMRMQFAPNPRFVMFCHDVLTTS